MVSRQNFFLLSLSRNADEKQNFKINDGRSQ